MKIISGGQTGVDRAALDVALDRCWPCGGWCPDHRAAEDGQISDKYPLRSLVKGGYPERTLQNILDSDATLVIHFGPIHGGTALTLNLCQEHAKPFLNIDGSSDTLETVVQTIKRFIDNNDVQTLNVAGPRASKSPTAYAYTYALLNRFMRQYPEYADE